MNKLTFALTAAAMTFAAAPGHAAVTFDESVSGDVDTFTAAVDALGQPTRTFIPLMAGTNTFAGSLNSPRDPADFIPFEILAGQTLTGLNVSIMNSLINDGTQIFFSSTSFSSGDFFIDVPLANFSSALPDLGPGTYGLQLGNGVVVLDYMVELEVAGAAVAAVPEPATWAFMIFGFGAIGGAMRRQKNMARKANVKVSYA
ncbi:PEPxxWA-CTERM sorting domain-containing protein [Parasphingorhabdus cellanae]|uniref:PEPxxWA-CTERM sorting domain-containing protein n=1 Tax=Parasphingorhabdus cellanae TaxID=2806553 RepID=A0ABX7T477_9SPHN|nr:PEPxxWA-CTERM sorting domain-containing protein [Parasphingorhabdus cellanae]QTD56391.1 PEPxxWA-CTERM sorting domain-containing protein [Parasphingorhabdus cellanae]